MRKFVGVRPLCAIVNASHPKGFKDYKMQSKSYAQQCFRYCKRKIQVHIGNSKPRLPTASELQFLSSLLSPLSSLLSPLSSLLSPLPSPTCTWEWQCPFRPRSRTRLKRGPAEVQNLPDPSTPPRENRRHHNQHTNKKQATKNKNSQTKQNNEKQNQTKHNASGTTSRLMRHERSTTQYLKKQLQEPAINHFKLAQTPC